mmetsp:Transcript_98687/g.284756  ORF Transcript_98687/g.284756 Transcript_98687/m.284756 type:complete len:195 (+) Transcript_98687:1637-2221(+)
MCVFLSLSALHLLAQASAPPPTVFAASAGRCLRHCWALVFGLHATAVVRLRPNSAGAAVALCCLALVPANVSSCVYRARLKGPVLLLSCGREPMYSLQRRLQMPVRMGSTAAMISPVHVQQQCGAAVPAVFRLRINRRISFRCALLVADPSGSLCVCSRIHRFPKTYQAPPAMQQRQAPDLFLALFRERCKAWR